MIDLEKRLRALENGVKDLKIAHGTTGSNAKTYLITRTFRVNVSVPASSTQVIRVKFEPSLQIEDRSLTQLSASVQRVTGTSAAYWGSHQVTQALGLAIDIPFINPMPSGSLSATYDITVTASGTVPGTLALVE